MPRTKSKRSSSTTRKRTSFKSTKSKSKNYSYSLKVPSDTKFLILHESPSEAGNVKAFQDKVEDFLWWTVVAMATIWHFYKTSSKSLDIDTKKWELKWKVDSAKTNNLSNMKKAFDTVKKNKGIVIIWTDPDREGEVIAGEIVKYLGLKKWQYKRLRIRDFSEKWYLEALKLLEDDLDWNMFNSGVARQILDKVIWFKMSPQLWKVANDYKTYQTKISNKINSFINEFENKYKELIKSNKSLSKMIEKYQDLDFNTIKDNRFGISIGRVQTPTLRLLIEKDLEKFEKKLQRKVNLFMEDKQWNTWEFYKNKDYETEPDKLEKVYSFLNQNFQDIKSCKITKIDKQKWKIKPPTPMDTQLAQSAMNSTFWYSLKTIMSILQDWYQQWVHTYMRTDSIDVPPKYIEYVKQMLKDNNIKAKFVMKNYKSDSADTQWWHHAILPTKPYKFNSIPWSWQNHKVWDYIVRRTVGSFLEDAEVEYITYNLEITIKTKQKEVKTYFLLKDKRLIKEWFMEVFNYSLDEYQQKFNFKVGDEIKIKDFELKEKDIKLPGTYSEGSLVKELKKLWIGRPSTWENIVSTLLNKEYIKKDWSKLVITEKWYWLYETIINNLNIFWDIFDLKFTAYMEDELDKIASWKQDKNKILDSFFKKLNINVYED